VVERVAMVRPLPPCGWRDGCKRYASCEVVSAKGNALGRFCSTHGTRTYNEITEPGRKLNRARRRSEAMRAYWTTKGR